MTRSYILTLSSSTVGLVLKKLGEVSIAEGLGAWNEIAHQVEAQNDQGPDTRSGAGAETGAEPAK